MKRIAAFASLAVAAVALSVALVYARDARSSRETNPASVLAQAVTGNFTVTLASAADTAPSEFTEADAVNRARVVAAEFIAGGPAIQIAPQDLQLVESHYLAGVTVVRSETYNFESGYGAPVNVWVMIFTVPGAGWASVELEDATGKVESVGFAGPKQ